MYFISDEIIETFEFQEITENKFTFYFLYIDNVLVYKGQVFLFKGQTNINIYLNDILKTYSFENSLSKINKLTNSKIIVNYKLILTIDNENFENNNSVYFYDLPTNKKITSLVTDGNLLKDRTKFVPIFPQQGNRPLNFTIKGNNNYLLECNSIELSNFSLENNIATSNIYTDISFQNNSLIYLQPNNEVVGKFGCGRYFLYWFTRNKCCFCYPFNGKTSESEEVSFTKIYDWIGRESHTQHKVITTFFLNTNFLNEEQRDVFRDILTSEKLYLYDSELDKLFNVVTEDNSFQIKKFENEKTFFNFSINLKKI